MFIPDHYRPSDPRWALDLIRRHPLALLVTVGADGLLATHLPVIPATEPAGDGAAEAGLTSMSFVGHMNRLNPHWNALRRGGPALMIFHGPEAYITPAIYETSPAAPTWNFTAVHLRGTIERIDDDHRMDVLKSTVVTYERDHGVGWDMTASLGYFDQLAPGVGAFRFAVTAAECIFKLSQDKPAEVRQKVIDSLAKDPSGRAHDVAATMQRYDLGVPR